MPAIANVLVSVTKRITVTPIILAGFTSFETTAWKPKMHLLL